MRKIVPLAVCFATIGHTAMAEDVAFNLYRNSVLDASMRIYIAAFNSDNGKDYNSENCWLAAKLFENQEGVKTKFWCEPHQKEG